MYPCTSGFLCPTKKASYIKDHLVIVVNIVIPALEFFFVHVYESVLTKIRNLSFNLGLEEVPTRKVTIMSTAEHTDIIHYTTIRCVRYTEKDYSGTKPNVVWLWITKGAY